MSAQIFEKALKLVPDLWVAAQIVARVAQRPVAPYPIKDVEELIGVAVDLNKDHCRLDAMTLTAANARDHFPRVFFPIDDEDELLVSLYAALCWGRSIHRSEQKLELHKQAVL